MRWRIWSRNATTGNLVTASMTCSPVLVRSAGCGRRCLPCDLGLVDMAPALVRADGLQRAVEYSLTHWWRKEVAVGLMSLCARLELVR